MELTNVSYCWFLSVCSCNKVTVSKEFYSCLFETKPCVCSLGSFELMFSFKIRSDLSGKDDREFSGTVSVAGYSIIISKGSWS